MTLESRIARRFRLTVGWCTALSFFIMSLGSLVRATDSGLACPDWPLCYDKAIPIFNTQIFFEWFHRVLAAALTLGIGYLGFQLYWYAYLRRSYGPQIAVAAVLLAVQIILGGLTVLKLLDPGIVSLHLINAVLFYSVLYWLFRSNGSFDAQGQLYGKKGLGWGRLYGTIAIVLFCQIFVGGMVSTSHSGLVCPDFPTCHGSWWPAASLPIWLQMSHRYVAFLLFLLAAGGAAMTAGQSLPGEMKQKILAMPFLVIAQVLLGVVNIYMELPVWASVLHLVNALVMYTLAMDVAITAYYGVKARSYDLRSGNTSRLSVMREAGL